ncbi:hypothetical protein MNBD_GAMMA01-471 [hydrothermal vent metagenome]|uniref:ABC-2 type transport system permease protein n=1 Tax=hydrothermal vent metagenome TaxID=652676 RepID=A0A3B0VPP0_9ZZZZ
MSIFQAELKYFLRSPIIWLIMAISAFISAWSFLLSIELFTVMQVKFASMSDAPTIMQGIIYPVIAAQAKLLILIVAIVAGLSFARLSHNNGWILIQTYRQSELHLIRQKYLAILLICLIFVIPSTLAIVSLAIIANLNIMPVIIAVCGLILLLMWMLALAMYISSLLTNTGFAILLCIVVLLTFWLLAQSSLDVVWGKNWLQALSPQYHFQQFLSSHVSVASLFYFVFGTIILLLAVRIRLIHTRYLLI